ncbi:hypothetical protein OSB04_001678 [Centaurea solstitialis]|uniref:BED-type domain-containing protein n=1 Tax=Centaurea solstitialis TaxID=347529 RepID=A0AA38WLM5_9ASTR|nr:hypothetical protein OSB04_001678 [Centaurea solstitialis]
METSQSNANEGLSQKKDEHVNVTDVTNEGSSKNIDEKKRGGKRSWVWDHFVEVDGRKYSQCLYCKTKMASSSTKNGTSSLRGHLEKVGMLSPFYKKIDDQKDKVLGILRLLSRGKRWLFLWLLIRLVKKSAEIISSTNVIPSRWTVARDCLSIYKDEMITLKGLLKGQIVSLTNDTWTLVQNYNYMCLLAHWVDDNWVLREKIFYFCQCSNHRGETIGKLVYKCLQKWGIEKVFTVIVDNASSNDGTIRFLKTMLKRPHAILDCKYLHLRCCAHIINLVVKDGLKEHFDSISRIRNVVRYVRSSPSRYGNFVASVAKVKSNCKRKPYLDCETRWNSAFLMLKTARNMRMHLRAITLTMLLFNVLLQYIIFVNCYKTIVFNRLSLVDNNYRVFFREINEAMMKMTKRNERALGAPGEEDWENARGFIEYLKIFFNVTKKVSGSQYVTSILFFGELVTMHTTIARMCLNMAISMKQKYDKYWDNIDNVNFLLHIALVLDPRNKLCYLEYCLGLIYGKHSNKCNEALDELYNQYKTKIDTSNVTHTNASSSSSAFFESSLKVDFRMNRQVHGRKSTKG